MAFAFGIGIVVLGSILCNYVPKDWQYTLGFAIGTLTMLVGRLQWMI